MSDKYLCPTCRKPLKLISTISDKEAFLLQRFVTAINNSEEFLNFNIDLSIFENNNDITKAYYNALNEKAQNEFLKRKFFENIQERFNIKNIDNIYIYDMSIFFHE